MEPHVRITHVSIQFTLRNESSHRIYYDNIHLAHTDQLFSDLQGLFSVVGLSHQHFFHIDSQQSSIADVESVLCINKCSHTTSPLHLCDCTECQGRLT